MENNWTKERYDKYLEEKMNLDTHIISIANLLRDHYPYKNDNYYYEEIFTIEDSHIEIEDGEVYVSTSTYSDARCSIFSENFICDKDALKLEIVKMDEEHKQNVEKEMLKLKAKQEKLEINERLTYLKLKEKFESS